MTKLFAAVVSLACFTNAASANLVFDWATVGNAGNANDSTGFGSVENEYRISKHEVTNDQYAYFLNKVASTSDPNGLFNGSMDITRTPSGGGFNYAVNGGFETNPVTYVSFFDAMRFTNWLENGQGTGGTESGVYSISDGLAETRATGATYFIPSEDEWYKAAYHDPNAVGSYWDFPTQSNSAPTAEVPAGGANSANMANAVGDTTAVGAYSGSTSFYGTFDQAGNVNEWNEKIISSSNRGVRGGSFGSGTGLSAVSGRFGNLPANENGFTGFRVASVPEPSSLLYLGLVIFGAGMWKKLTTK